MSIRVDFAPPNRNASLVAAVEPTETVVGRVQQMHRLEVVGYARDIIRPRVTTRDDFDPLVV